MTPSPPGSPLLVPVSKRGTPGQANSIRNQWQHLQPDPGPTTDASRIAYQRMPHHAGMSCDEANTMLQGDSKRFMRCNAAQLG
jgi:hypothetical protein